MLDIRQIECFVAAGEELHFGRAASRLHLAQPSVSNHIQALETRLGVQLFDRNTRRVVLTKAGAALLEPARQALDKVVLAEQVARRAARGEIGRISVGYSGSALFTEAMPRILSSFRRRYPDVALALEDTPTIEQHRRLLAGQQDVGFAWGLLSALPSRLSRLAVASEQLVVVLPQDSDLARLDRVPLRALSSLPFILRATSGHSGTDFIRGLCLAADFEPIPAQYVPRVIAIPSMVAAGLGVSIVPESISRVAIPNVVYRPLADVDDTLQLSLIWPEEARDIIVLRLIDEARALSRKLKAG